jgi:hypothetical protein
MISNSLDVAALGKTFFLIAFVQLHFTFNRLLNGIEEGQRLIVVLHRL